MTRVCTTLGCPFTTEELMQFCPDDGAPLKDAETTTNVMTAAAVAPTEIHVAPMPTDDLDTRPVIASILLPSKQEAHLREGEHFTIASERNNDANVNLKLNDAEFPGVSSQILDIFVENGEVKVVGGGTNGFKITTVESHKADETIVVKKGQTIVAGAKAPFRVK